jgi:hypothetical protein
LSRKAVKPRADNRESTVTRNHNVSETGPNDSVLRWGVGDPLLSPLKSDNLNHWTQLTHSEGPNRMGASFPSPEGGNRSSFRNVAFSSYLEFRTMDKVQKPSDSQDSPSTWGISVTGFRNPWQSVILSWCFWQYIYNSLGNSTLNMRSLPLLFLPHVTITDERRCTQGTEGVPSLDVLKPQLVVQGLTKKYPIIYFPAVSNRERVGKQRSGRSDFHAHAWFFCCLATPPDASYTDQYSKQD